MRRSQFERNVKIRCFWKKNLCVKRKEATKEFTLNRYYTDIGRRVRASCFCFFVECNWREDKFLTSLKFSKIITYCSVGLTQEGAKYSRNFRFVWKGVICYFMYKMSPTIPVLHFKRLFNTCFLIFFQRSELKKNVQISFQQNLFE